MHGTCRRPAPGLLGSFPNRTRALRTDLRPRSFTPRPPPGPLPHAVTSPRRRSPVAAGTAPHHPRPPLVPRTAPPGTAPPGHPRTRQRCRDQAMRAAPGPMHHQSIAPAPRGTASHGGLGGERGAAGAGTRTPRGNQGARGTEGAGGSLRDHGGYGGCRLRCAGRARSRSRPRTEAAVHPTRRETASPPTGKTLTTDRPTPSGRHGTLPRDEARLPSEPPSLRAPCACKPRSRKGTWRGDAQAERTGRGWPGDLPRTGATRWHARGPGSRSSSRTRTAH